MRMRVVLVFWVLLALAGTGRADELADLNEQILKDPQNVELNLRYAHVAEQKGDLRKALSAYERITVNNPSNKEAQDGFRRVTRKLQPDTTNVAIELGTGWESNPARAPTNPVSDWLATARVDVKDERRFGDVNWRTLGTGVGEYYRWQGGDLNYGSLGVLTGPISDLTSQIALHTGVGLGIAGFGQHLLYKEGVGGLTLETGFWQGTQSTRFRLGYRRYGEFYGSGEGLYADLSTRLGFTDVLQKKDILVITPWLRWSGINGTPLFVPLEETQPGHYRELGIRPEYYMSLTDWMLIGGSMGISYRHYIDVTLLETGEPVFRRDLLLNPGLSVIFPGVLGKTIDLRFDYKYEDNRSNVPFDQYTDHQVTASVGFRF
jgi:hypothetical protein